MFHRSTKKMISTADNSTFAKYLLQVTTQPENFPAFLDSKKRVVMPRVARAYGLAVNNETKSINIDNEKFYDGDYSNLTIKDELNNDICAFNQCQFINITLARSDFANGQMRECMFRKVGASGSHFSSATVHFTDFANVILDDADCRDALFLASDINLEIAMSGCSFLRTDLRNARIITQNSDSITSTEYMIFNSTFEGDLPNVTIAGFDIVKNRFSHSIMNHLVVRNGKSSYCPDGAYFFRNEFTNITFNDSALPNAMFSENTFDHVAFINTNLSSTIWDLGKNESNMDHTPLVVNVFRNTSMQDVDASNSLLIDHGAGAYGKKNIHDIDGLDACETDVTHYFKSNNVSITGNSTFGSNDAFTCLNTRIAATIPICIVAAIAFTAFVSRYLSRNCQEKNTVAKNMRLFKLNEPTPTTPLLPVRATL